jgi:hypothetical protein
VEKSELVDLIPLYVTGKLSDDQKATIERELPKSAELRDEIAFWQSARGAVQKEAAYSLAGHLTSERIVDYARGAISSPLEKANIEHHLQGCQRCRLDLETIRPAFVRPERAVSSSFFEQLIYGVADSVRSAGRQGLKAVFRPIYALPLLAILVVSVILLYEFGEDEAHPISIALQFQTQARSSSAREVQTIKLAEEVTVVHLSVPIPHAAVQPAPDNIRLMLSSPEQKELLLNQGLSWSVGGDAFDTVKVSIPASVLRTAGTYSLRAVIRYTDVSEPFEYSYMLAIAHPRELR